MDLTHLRKKIDTIDSGLVRMINERAKISLAIGKAKLKNRKGIYVADRERDVLERVKSANKGPMVNGAFEAIYREIMSSSLSLEKPLRIAHLGAEGSNSYVASVRKFGSQVRYVSCASIAEVFGRVDSEDCDYGVVPIENSVEGTVTPTADLLVDADVQICAQLMQRITYSLLAKGSWEKISKVYSNPQALAQCRNWLLANLPPNKARQIHVASTTDAVLIAMREKNAAAVAPPECAKIYDMPVLRENIQDISHNTTRFFVIGRHDVRATGRDRTSMVFSVKDQAGALQAMLAPFAKGRINLTKIESRPMKRKAWAYYFFVDLEGHREDAKVKNALLKLEKTCSFLKVLGSYPA